MDLALSEARATEGTGDVPIGAVVLDPDGRVIGRGYNRREADGDPTAHAEVLALRKASRALGSWRLEGCTLVVTLEPCVMCAGTAVMAVLFVIVLARGPRGSAPGPVVGETEAEHTITR